MIRISVIKNDSIIEEIKVTGHANYAEYGRDLVCAAISSISLGMCNALDELCSKDALQFEIKEGLIRIRVLHSSSDLQLLLKAWIIELKTVAVKYPDFVRIIQKGV